MLGSEWWKAPTTSICLWSFFRSHLARQSWPSPRLLVCLYSDCPPIIPLLRIRNINIHYCYDTSWSPSSNIHSSDSKSSASDSAPSPFLCFWEIYLRYLRKRFRMNDFPVRKAPTIDTIATFIAGLGNFFSTDCRLSLHGRNMLPAPSSSISIT